MRSMPQGHRLLLPVRRVIATKVVFTSDPRNPWERSHSAQGIHGVTTIVEHAPALAHQDAQYNADQVRDMQDGETPKVISDNFVDLPETEDFSEEGVDVGDSSKYRGPADATIGSRETGEDRENLPVTFLCHEHLLASGSIQA